MAEFLLDKGININEIDNEGQTAIFKCKNIELVDLLVERGINLSLKDKNNMTALFYLSKCSNSNDIVQILIKHGIYIKEKDNVYGNSVTYSSTIENPKYNSGNYDVSYHDSPESIKSQSGVYGTDFGTTMVVDPCGNKILIPYNESQGHSIYYEPGSYKYGASTYIPTYEDSVYFSKNNYYGNTSFKPTTKTPSTLKYSRLSKNDGENITYTEPQFIISSTYIPSSEITTYSSKTSGVDTTSIYT
jgi:ankyrin repeat protein